MLDLHIAAPSLPEAPRAHRLLVQTAIDLRKRATTLGLAGA